MIVISHRGNIDGKNLDFENNPKHIQNLLDKGIDVEIDVWCYKNNFYLGHDEPLYKINKKFLLQKKLWCHAKNLKSLENLLNFKTVCFWHQEDNYTLTSNGFIWTYPKMNVNKKSIIVDLDISWKNKKYECFGVCSDYIL
jgi:hypothetical protein